MVNHASTINQMSDQLSRGRSVDAAQMEALAREYNSHVKEAQRRLGQCCDHINQGRRAEAVECAEVQPRLLNLIDALSFAGISHWNALARQFGLPSAPPFDAGMVELLRKAYDGAEALEPLRKVYQVLVLTGGSTLDKIQHLRRIRTLDPGSASWSQDLRELEAVRDAELTSLLDSKRANLSESELSELLKEMTRTDLSVRPSRARLERVQQRLHTLKTQRVHATMEGFASLLNDAYATRDFDKVDAHLNTVEHISKSESVPYPERWRDGIEDAREWRDARIAERRKDEEFSQNVADLQRMLAGSAEPGAIRELLGRMERSGRIPPHELRARAEETIARHEARTKRARDVKRAAIAGGAAVAACLCVWIALRVIEGNKRRGIARDISALTLEGNYIQAQRVIDEAKIAYPGIESESEFKREAAAFEAARKGEDVRREQWNRDFDFLKSGLKGNQPPAASSDERLAALETNARTAAEKNGLEALKAEMASAWKEYRDACRRDFDQLQADISTQLARATAMKDPAELQELLKNVESELGKQREKNNSGRLEVADRIEKSQKEVNRLEKVAESLAAAKKKAEGLRTEAVGALSVARRQFGLEIGSYVASLQRDREKYKDVLPEYRDFEAWKPNASGYAAALAWGRVAQALLEHDRRAPFGDEAAARKEFNAALLDKGNRAAFYAGPYKDILDKHARRAQALSAGESMKALKARLDEPVISKLQQFTATKPSGEKILYYTDDDQAKKNPGRRRQVLMDSSDRMASVYLNDEDAPYTVPAHVMLAKSIQALILDQEAKAPKWASNLPKAVKLINDSTDADPYVRALLLDALFALDSQGIDALLPGTDLTKKMHDLAAKELPFWVPTPEVRKQLEAIGAELHTLRPAVARAIVAAEERALRERAEVCGIFRPLRWSAVAELDATGAKTAIPIEAGKAFGELWTVHRTENGTMVFKIVALPGADGKPRWIENETVAAGQPLLSPADGKDTLEAAHECGADKIGLPAPFPVNLQQVRKLK